MSRPYLHTGKKEMSAINWTTEQPTEEGWYWVRLIDANWINDKCETVAYIKPYSYQDGTRQELLMYVCGCELGLFLEAATHFYRISQC